MTKRINLPNDVTIKAARSTIMRLAKVKWPGSFDLRQQLQDCVDFDDYHCQVASCRMCREIVHNRFSKLVSRRYKSRSSVQLLTIVPSAGRCSYDEIDDFDLRRFVRNTLAKLRRLLPEGTILLGAIDVSLNIDGSNGSSNTEKWWQFHFHIIMSERPDRDVEIKLRSRFPADVVLGIKRPVQFVNVPKADLRSSAAYVYKSYFTQRSSYIVNYENRAPAKGSRDQSLSADADALLHYALRKYTVFDLMFSIGLKRSSSSDLHSFRFLKSKKGNH